MAEVMTYTSLVNDVLVYAERENDQKFIDQVPRFIALAEFRIAIEVKGLGLKRAVAASFGAGNPVVTKPARWRETVSWNYGTGTGDNTRNMILPRSYEYCRVFWPDDDLTGLPRYYADYDFEHFLVVPTPASAYPFELIYHERPTPLDSNNQDSWTTKNAPQLLLYATLLEAQPYLKVDERIPVWQAAYDRAAAAISGEDRDRVHDSSLVRKGA